MGLADNLAALGTVDRGMLLIIFVSFHIFISLCYLFRYSLLLPCGFD